MESKKFKKIDDVDWSSLKPCFDDPLSIPIWLNDLASLDIEVCKYALSKLNDNILHQGSVREITVQVVPFLNQALSSKNTQCKDGVLELIYDLSLDCTLARESINGGTISNFKNFTNTGSDSAYYEQKVYDEILDGVPIYLLLLGEPNVNIRIEAVRVLSLLVEKAEEILPSLLNQMLLESDSVTKATFIFYTAELLSKARSTKKFSEHETLFILSIVHLVNPNHATALGLATSIALAQTMMNEAPENVAVELRYAINHFDSYQSLLWKGCNVLLDASDAVIKLGVNRGLSIFVDALNHVQSSSAAKVFTKSILLLVGPFNKNDLTKEQELALSSIVQCDKFWEFRFSNDIIYSYGLGGSRDDLVNLISNAK